MSIRVLELASVDVLQHDRREAEVTTPVVGAHEAEPVRERKTKQRVQVARILGDLAEMRARVDLTQPGEGSEAAERHRKRPTVRCTVRTPGEFYCHDLGLSVAREASMALGYAEHMASDWIAAVAGANLV